MLWEMIENSNVSCVLHSVSSVLWSSYCLMYISTSPDSKFHGANMGPIWGRQDPGGPHVGPMNFVIWVSFLFQCLFGSGLFHHISVRDENCVWNSDWRTCGSFQHWMRTIFLYIRMITSNKNNNFSVLITDYNHYLRFINIFCDNWRYNDQFFYWWMFFLTVIMPWWANYIYIYNIYLGSVFCKELAMSIYLDQRVLAFAAGCHLNWWITGLAWQN